MLSELSNEATNGLLECDANSHCTLLSTSNLQFFFERYELGDFEAIKSRFYRATFGARMNNNQIIGLYRYLQFLADTLVESDPQKADDWASYQAFGSWLSLTLKTSYDHVFQVVRQWAPTRFLAAMVSS